MQLQKRLNRKVGNVEYTKWQIVIPPETITELGWKEGEALQETIEGYKLTLTPSNKVKKQRTSENRNFDEEINLLSKSKAGSGKK